MPSGAHSYLPPQPASTTQSPLERTTREGFSPSFSGLLLWKDKENYLRLDRGTRGEREICFRGCLENQDVIIGRGQLPLKEANTAPLWDAPECENLDRSPELVRTNPRQVEGSASGPQQVEESANGPRQVEESGSDPRQVEGSTNGPQQVEESGSDPRQVEESTNGPQQVEESANGPQQAEESANDQSVIEVTNQQVRTGGRGEFSGRIILRLERVSDQAHAFCSADGEDWFTVGHVPFPVEDPIQVGLCAFSLQLQAASGSSDHFCRTVYHSAYPDGTAIRFESLTLWELDR